MTKPVWEKLYALVNEHLYNNALPRARCEDRPLGDDRRAQFSLTDNVMTIDCRRIRSPRDWLTVFAHEVAHRVRGGTPETWHDERFEREHSRIEVFLLDAAYRHKHRTGEMGLLAGPGVFERQPARRGAPANHLVRTGPGGQPDARALLARVTAREANHMNESLVPPDRRAETFAARQRRAIEQWPEYRRGARSVEQRPHYDDRSGSDLVERRLRRMRDRASRW